MKGRGYVLDTTVTIGYDTPWRQVQSLLLAAASRTEGVLADPEPRVFQTALSDFYVEYRLVTQAVPELPAPARRGAERAARERARRLQRGRRADHVAALPRGDPAEPKVAPGAEGAGSGGAPEPQHAIALPHRGFRRQVQRAGWLSAQVGGTDSTATLSLRDRATRPGPPPGERGSR